MKPKSQTYYQPLAASSSIHDSLRRISRMASLPLADVNCYGLSNNRAVLLVDFLAVPLLQMGGRPFQGFATKGKLISERFCGKDSLSILRRGSGSLMSKKLRHTAVRSGSSSNSGGSEDNSSDQGKKPFGYNRKDVLLIGVGVMVFGIGLKSGLEFAGVDPLQAGNVVQLVCVLGLTIGWISTYIFRVSNKEMTYAQQLRDYENKVMQKRLDSLTEAEVEVLLEQVEEDKRRVANGEQIK